MTNILKTKNKKIFFRYSQGYTMIEMLAVMIILAAVGSVVVGLISSTLRGSNKTNSMNQIRQEGNNRLSAMAKMVEFARSFDGISTDGVDYDPDCTPEIVELTPVPNQEHYSYLKVTNFSNNQLIFSCSMIPDTSILTLASNSANLFDTNSLDVTDCYFTCTQNYLAQPPVIGIYFTLSEKNPGNVIEKNTTVSFETNVSMRNLGR